MPAKQPTLCWEQRAMPFWLALCLKKLTVNTTTTVGTADWPNLYFFYLQGMVAKLSVTGGQR
jgi:hypothetical protein